MHCTKHSTKALQQQPDPPTNNDIEMSVYGNQSRSDEDITIEAIEFYISKKKNGCCLMYMQKLHEH